MKEKKNCSKCTIEMKIQNTKVNLVLDEEMGTTTNVTARIHICPTCKKKEFTDKEKKRLQELKKFYIDEQSLGTDYQEAN